MSDRSAVRIPASIEVSPKQAAESLAIEGLFPEGTRVYMTDVGVDPTDLLVRGAKRLNDLGYRAVPHFASRRMLAADVLEDRVSRMVGEAGVEDVLVIGGGLDREAGPFGSTMDVLNTGVFERHGITHMGVAGHPEGSPDFDSDTAIQALRDKQDFAERTGIDVRIVTQFGFDGTVFAAWADAIRDQGIHLPVHLGVAGPAKVTTLAKYAAMCGVGASLSFLKKRGGAMATMIKGFDPDDVVRPIEARWRAGDSTIAQIHVFPFGGPKKSTAWLTERGTWPETSGNAAAAYAATSTAHAPSALAT